MASIQRLFVFFIALALLFGCAGPAQPINITDANHSANATQNNPTEISPNTGEIVVLETSKGDIEIELDRSAAPVTVDNFVNYVESGFYDGTIFHRVMKGFMIQGGGFTPDGKQKSANRPIKLESDNGLKNIAGSVAMARTSAPDSATSEFFINTVDNPALDYRQGTPGYAVFGHVVSGMDVVHAIESVQTGDFGRYSDWPVVQITITKAYMKSAP